MLNYLLLHFKVNQPLYSHWTQKIPSGGIFNLTCNPMDQFLITNWVHFLFRFNYYSFQRCTFKVALLTAHDAKFTAQKIKFSIRIYSFFVPFFVPCRNNFLLMIDAQCFTFLAIHFSMLYCQMPNILCWLIYVPILDNALFYVY